jgi:ATP-dependent exoDNAse (exonuclease V) alpha subunit
VNCRRLSVYEAERAELAVGGDRVRITRDDAARDLGNGDRFIVSAVGPTSVTLVDGRRSLELPAGAPLHLDHAYARTVHGSQGPTAERVLIDAATSERSTPIRESLSVTRISPTDCSAPWSRARSRRRGGLRQGCGTQRNV